MYVKMNKKKLTLSDHIEKESAKFRKREGIYKILNIGFCVGDVDDDAESIDEQRLSHRLESRRACCGIADAAAAAAAFFLCLHCLTHKWLFARVGRQGKK